MPDVFLSYSREDQAVARRFAESLEREGIDVWWDQSLDPGETYDEVTSNALDSSLAVVVLWSSKSVSSRWVRAEATLADRQGKLFPAQIEACRLPIQFELTQTADLSGWSGDRGDPRWQPFVASLRRVFARQRSASAAEGGVRSPPASAPVPPPSVSANPRRNRVFYIGIAALVMLGLAIGAWKILAARHATQPAAARDPEAPRETAAAAAAAQPSIAVLPFVNMSSDPEQEYFSDGLSEELLNELVKVPQLRVIGRTSSFAFKGKNQDLRTIGEALGVNHILEGSVRKAGDRVRITAQLINPADGSHLWSQVYERRIEDVFAIQEEIARTVANSLRLTLAAGSGDDGGTRNFTAYDEFLAGRAGLNKNFSYIDSATVAHLERAVQLDPNYLTAWIWLIDAYTRQLFSVDQREAARKRQTDAIAHVVSIAPDSQFARIAQSYGALVKPDLVEAGQLLSASLGAPSSIGWRTRLRYGQFLGLTGRGKDAVPVLQQVHADDPLDLFAWQVLAGAYGGAGDFEKAASERAALLAQSGGGTLIERSLGMGSAMQRGDHEAVLQELRAYQSIDPHLGPVLWRHRDNLAAAVPELAATLRNDSLNRDIYLATRVAAWAGYLGAPDVALEAMKSAARLGLSLETWAGQIWSPTFAEARRMPGFKGLARELGLVDYWRATGNWGDFCKPVGNDDFECH